MDSLAALQAHLARHGSPSDILEAMAGHNPMASLQMEQLGAVFHVNGPYAAQVSELLSRVVSRPMGHLPITLGWRKGDSASIFAQSAGGQAVALLSFCLKNMYTDPAVGQILSHLCSVLLSGSFRSGVHAHLADAAGQLGDKLNRIGFGNLLAQQAVKITTVYKQLGTKRPGDLFETPSPESMAGIFTALQHLSDDRTTVTISGSLGMVHLLTTFLFMFPENVIATVETHIIHQGSQPKLRVNIAQLDSTSILVTNSSNISLHLHLPIFARNIAQLVKRSPSFEWSGWLARKLQFELAVIGVLCSEDIRRTCCDMLVQLACHKPQKDAELEHTTAATGGLVALLGLSSESRMTHVCETLLLATPSRLKPFAEKVLPKAWTEFMSHIDDLTGLQCTCRQCHFQDCFISERPLDARSPCRYHDLWTCIGSVLNAGLHCLAIDTPGPVSINGLIEPLRWFASTVNMDSHSTSEYIRSVMHLVTGVEDCCGYVGMSSGGCAVYPTLLNSLASPPEGIFSFQLVDGNFIFDEQYHTNLRSAVNIGNRADTSPAIQSPPIIRSSLGDCSNISLNVRQGWKELVLSCTAQVSGRSIQLELLPILQSYISKERARPFIHRIDKPLVKSYNNSVIATRMTAPAPLRQRVPWPWLLPTRFLGYCVRCRTTMSIGAEMLSEPRYRADRDIGFIQDVD